MPLAFRTGSRSKQRVHIFWQRRIRAGDTTTPWWFPSQTKSGAIREDRLVLPIPPGTHWRDAKPIVLPGASDAPQRALAPARPPGPRKPLVQKVAVIQSFQKRLQAVPAGKAGIVTASGIKYLQREDDAPQTPAKPARAPRAPAAKHDAKEVAFVRELRDRFLEQINSTPMILTGKYDVSRALTLDAHPEAHEVHALPAPLAAKLSCPPARRLSPCDASLPESPSVR